MVGMVVVAIAKVSFSTINFDIFELMTDCLPIFVPHHLGAKNIFLHELVQLVRRGVRRLRGHAQGFDPGYRWGQIANHHTLDAPGVQLRRLGTLF